MKQTDKKYSEEPLDVASRYSFIDESIDTLENIMGQIDSHLTSINNYLESFDQSSYSIVVDKCERGEDSKMSNFSDKRSRINKKIEHLRGIEVNLSYIKRVIEENI